jgi:type III secretion protein L
MSGMELAIRFARHVCDSSGADIVNMMVSMDKEALVAVAGKVVKAAQFTQLVQMQEAVSQAQRYAMEIRARATTEAWAVRRAGFQRGMQEARAEFAVSMVEATAKVEAAFIGLEGRIVNTVMSAVQQILGASDQRIVFEGVIRRVLAQARAEKSLRLRVSASQYDQVNAILAEILQEFPGIEFIDVVKDPGGVAGTCVLESEFGIVDASLDTQLAAIRRGLISSFVGKRPNVDPPA